MTVPAIEIGEKVHVITRRLFETDVRRHFVGEVTRTSGDAQEVRGYAFVFQPGSNEYRRMPELRTRVFSLRDVGLIVVKLPSSIEIESIEYRLIEKRLTMTDGKGFTLDINEFGPSR